MAVDPSKRECTKRKFDTWDEANFALLNAKIARWKYSGRTRRHEARIYWCGLCVGHHLTSQPDLTRTDIGEVA